MARGKRYYQNASGASKVDKTIIYWDENRSKYVVKAPFSEAFRNNIQALVGSAIYLGNTEQAYSFIETDLPFVITVVEGVFGADEYELMKRPEAVMVMDANGAGKWAIDFLLSDGEESAKKVYRFLLSKYHPDTNPSPEAHEKAAKITEAWRNFKKEMGWP